ncbi:metabotropic glutamate receptor 3-like isoform X2 [Palaemon carinicauda]|uniref:metabotropic glutamate receptor 3-like isoform X2 n=1 Tax=Palaemon carinicauda TaxID=392227 RepID=UPI0035B69906
MKWLHQNTKMMLATVLLSLLLTLGQPQRISSQRLRTNNRATLNVTLVYPEDATILIGALFPIHNSKTVNGVDVCGELQGEDGIQPLEAMLYTLDEINSNPDLLPGIKLGALVMDSCNSPTLALDQSLGFIKGFLAGQNQYHTSEFMCGDGSIPLFRGGQFDKVVGVIGGQSSSISVQMASVLRVIEMPQISYLSTSASLSNKERYPYFLRTVPSDSNQAEAILKILRSFGWSYASLVYSGDDYGEDGHRQLKAKAAEFDVCFASPHRISKEDDDLHYRKVVDDLKKEATVVVVFAHRRVFSRLMRTVELADLHSRFMWVGSDGWSSSTPEQMETVLEGAIAVEPLARPLPGFDEYFQSLSSESNTRNPWFAEYWKSRNNVRNQKRTPYRQMYWLHFVRDAVYAFAHALNNLWQMNCNGKEGLCNRMGHDGHIHGDDLLEQLLNVTFTDVTGNPFRFLENGAGLPRYTIQNYQRLQGYNYSWVPVGNYSRTSADQPELFLNEPIMKYRHESPFPKSSCGVPCLPGQARIPLQDTCCWRCEDCHQHQYLNSTTQQCNDCDKCNTPNSNRNGCVIKEEKFIDYKNRWAITSMAFASTGIFSTVLVAVIFWIHLDTPVIKAASRELSYILLAGIMLSFVMTFVIVSPPSQFTCGLTRFFLGFSYTVCYAAILTKTNRISRIFNKNPTKPTKARYTSPMSQLVIVTLLVSVEVVINISWLVYYTPTTKHLCDQSTDYRIRICNGLDDYSYIVGLIYPLVLVCFCTVYAIKTRKCPGGFNEARYIAFTNYTTCLIWLVFVPLYISTGATDDVRIVTLAMSLSLGGFVQLGCLFFPKIHIVLFKPEKNTRDAVMSITRTSSYRGSGRRPGPEDQHQSAPAIIFLNNTTKQGGKDEGGLKVPPAHFDPGIVTNKDPSGKVNEGYLSVIPPKNQDTAGM